MNFFCSVGIRSKSLGYRTRTTFYFWPDHASSPFSFHKLPHFMRNSPYTHGRQFFYFHKNKQIKESCTKVQIFFWLKKKLDFVLFLFSFKLSQHNPEKSPKLIMAEAKCRKWIVKGILSFQFYLSMANDHFHGVNWIGTELSGVSKE